ncbi:MAG TPA: type 1 glutamine amidotransferase family protein [Anaerolineales bacterium]|nr:type 1 glutamine amidotransferase family protein [Anaerolineales bacterium]HLO27849.1 type 1 glutamine amidotransferase family protein [Anaerolineales bacterium]
MKQKRVYVYVQDTWSDWEVGYATAELNSGRFFKNKGERLIVKTVGLTKDPITTMGGMSITPDLTLRAVTVESSAMLILVGGDTWQDPKHQPIIAKAKELLEANCNVAAICGATSALAEAGLFDNRPHTSNGIEYLKMVAPHYQGDAHYKEDRAVSDGNLITASSAGPLQFARYILQRLEVFSDEALEAWYNYFNTGEVNYFFALMSALPKS